MTTARDLITQALKDLGVLENGEIPSGAEGEDTLAVLNQTLQSWIYEGIDLEFENLDIDDTIPYPEDHLGPFRYNLAVRAAPMFGVMPSPVIAKMADDGFKQLQREYLDPDEMGIDDALRTVYNSNGYFLNSSNF